MKDFEEIKLGKDYVGHRMFLSKDKLLHIVAPEYKTISFKYYCPKDLVANHITPTVVAPFQCWVINYSRNLNTTGGHIRSVRLAFTLEDPIKNHSTRLYQSWLPNCGYDEHFDMCLGDDWYHIARSLGNKFEKGLKNFAFDNYNYFWNSKFNTDLSPNWLRGNWTSYYELSHYLDTTWTIEYIQSEEFKKQAVEKYATGYTFEHYLSEPHLPDYS